MEFKIKRTELFEAAKSMKAVVPKSCHLKELEGFLLDSDEDSGEIVLTATNLESSIQRRLKASVGISGSCVIDAKLLCNIVFMLAGEDVSFKLYDNGQIIVNGGNCVYSVPTMQSKNYPRPEIPLPEDTIKVTGICDLYARTFSAVASNNNKPVLTGIHLDIYSDCIRAVACDGTRLALTKKMSETGGMLSVTIPKISLQHLASAVDNKDGLDVGMCGNFLVFMKKDLLFSVRLLVDDYINTDQLLDSVTGTYTAKTDSGKLADAVDIIRVLAETENDYAKRKMNMQFGEGEIKFFIKNDNGTSDSSVPAVISNPTPAGGFWYNPELFSEAFRTVRGDVEIHVSDKGFIHFKCPESQYMIGPLRPPSVKTETAKQSKAA